jgi:hypothetical protein
MDARHNGMCSGRRSRTRVPGMTSVAITSSVGWAKAHLRRAHHFLNRMSSRRVVGTPPSACAPGRFAHPTHLRATVRKVGAASAFRLALPSLLAIP